MRSGLTFRISDPAPVTPGLQLRRNRGVRCIRFVRPCRSHSQKPLTTMAEESRQRNPRLNAERSFLCQTFRCRHRLGRHEPSVRRLNSPKSPASKTESPKTARCKSAQRTQSNGAKWSNVPAQRPLATDVRIATQTRSRGSLQPVCYAFLVDWRAVTAECFGRWVLSTKFSADPFNGTFELAKVALRCDRDSPPLHSDRNRNRFRHASSRGQIAGHSRPFGLNHRFVP